MLTHLEQEVEHNATNADRNDGGGEQPARNDEPDDNHDGNEGQDALSDLMTILVRVLLGEETARAVVNPSLSAELVTETHILLKAEDGFGLARLGLLDVVVQDGVAHIG